MPNKDKKVRWIRFDGEDSDLANLRDDDAELAKHRIELCEQAVATARENGNRREEGAALLKLGVACFSLGKLHCAIEHYEQALSIYREIGDRNREARTLSNTGAVYLLLGQMEHAFQCHEQALSIAREIGDRNSEANTLRNLGTDYLRMGQKGRAIECYQQALSISREIGDHDKEAMILVNMGAIYSNLGQVEKAIEITQAAVQILEESGGPGADYAREQLDHLYTQKSNKIPYLIPISIGLILVTLVAVFGLFNSPTANNNYSSSDISTLEAIQTRAKLATTEQNRYVSIEELYRNAPANFTEQKDWKQWENEYVGKYVKGKGRFDSVSAHPQKGKLFFIVTILGEEGTIENSTTQVALLVEDAHTIALGEKEGSFLIDGTKWIYLGENYAFEGSVSGFSSFNTELVISGYSDLIILKGKMMDIRKE